MTNADKFKNIFGLYATELWSMPEKDFLKWLNSEAMNCSEFPNNSDTISRQEAIDALDRRFDNIPMEQTTEILQLRRDLRQLPPAQPEIIRCTECKHYREYDSEYVANAVVVQCMADRYPISETIPDGWFCAGAERKDDE